MFTTGGQTRDGGRQGGRIGGARTEESAVQCVCEPIWLIVVPSVVTFAMAPGKLQSAPDLQACPVASYVAASLQHSGRSAGTSSPAADIACIMPSIGQCGGSNMNAAGAWKHRPRITKKATIWRFTTTVYRLA